MNLDSFLDEPVRKNVDTFLDEPPAAPEMRPIERSTLGAVSEPFQRGLARARQGITTIAGELGLYRGAEPDLAARQAQQQREVERFPVPPDVQAGLEEISSAPTMGEAAKAIVRNPRAVFETAVESVGTSAPTLLGAAAGSAAGPKGTAAGAGIGSFATEYAAVLSEAMSERGIAATDPFERDRAQRDPEFMAAAREKAIKRGIPIAIFDALTAGTAGKLLAGAKPTVGSIAPRVAGEAALQAGGGGAGEAVAQAVTGEYKPGEILMEAAAEIPSMVVEAPGNVRSARAKDPNVQISRAIEEGVRSTQLPNAEAAALRAMKPAAPPARPAQAAPSAPSTVDAFLDQAASNAPTSAPAAAPAANPASAVEPFKYDPYPDLTPEQREVETRFGQKIAANPDGAVAEYRRRFGKVINTDKARELSDDYDAGPEARSKWAGAVHEPASAVTKRVYKTMLAEQPKGNESPLVLFTAGGTGAGKTTAVDHTPASREIHERAQIVFDTNMNTFDSAKKKIDQALEAQKQVVIAYVHADPISALNRALGRAMNEKSESHGRTVPMHEHINTHVGANAVARRMALQYAHDPRVKILVIDNTGDFGTSKLMNLADLPQIEYTTLDAEARQILDEAYSSGRISEAVYRGFAGHGPASGADRAPAGQPRPADGSGLPGNAAPVRPARPEDAAVAAPGRNAQGAPSQGQAQEVAPAAVGAPSPVVTERGQRLETRFAVIDAAQLVTSHDNALRPNAAFPAELQPRDRSRAASEAQIARIENAINPELLAESPKASDGAPIIGRDGVVESGNARTIALRRAYGSGKAAAYRAWLVQNAARFGLDPAAIEGAQQPVLVRISEGEYNRAEFARQANESAVAAMSATEQAAADVERMPDLDRLVTNDDGTINPKASAPFIRDFVESVPPTERGPLMTADGSLSQQGLARIRNAIFAKAYGDAEIVGMMAESTDANVRNVLAGMVRAAPAVAKLREMVEAGARFPTTIARDLAKAVRLFSQLRADGMPVKAYLAQAGMFDDGVGPAVEGLLTRIDENSRAPKRIADMIGELVGAEDARGDPRQGGMFAQGKAPSPAGMRGPTPIPLNEQQRGAVEAGLAALGKKGFPTWLAGEVEIVGHSSLQSQYPALYDRDARRVSLRQETMENYDATVRALGHELTHALDDTGPTMLSAKSPRLAYTFNTVTQEFDVRGDIMAEVVKAYTSAGPLAQHFAYPLAYAGVTDPEVIKAEVFAQLGALYVWKPALMKSAMPAAYAAMKEIYDASQSATPDQARQQLRQTLRVPASVGGAQVRGASGAAGNAGSAQANRGVSQRGPPGARVAAAGEAGGRGDGFDLTSPSAGELRTQDAIAQREAEAKRKRDAAPPADDFTLTGSDRPADEAEARGQGTLFMGEAPSKSPMDLLIAKGFIPQSQLPAVLGAKLDPRQPTHINYERINAPEDVKITLANLSQTFERQIQTQRRGTVSWDESYRQAAEQYGDLVGADLGTLSRTLMRKPGTPAGVAELLARRALAVRAASVLTEQAKAIAAAPERASQQQLAEFAANIDRSGMILATYLGARAEAGRALGVLASVDRGLTGRPPQQPKSAPAPQKRTPKPEPLAARPKQPAARVFTEEKANAARELLRRKLAAAMPPSGRTLGMGAPVQFDAEMLQAGIELAGFHIENGARSFAAFSQAMLEDLGPAARPYLKAWYAAVRNYPGFDATGMDELAARTPRGASRPKDVRFTGTDTGGPAAPAVPLEEDLAGLSQAAGPNATSPTVPIPRPNRNLPVPDPNAKPQPAVPLEEDLAGLERASGNPEGVRWTPEPMTGRQLKAISTAIENFGGTQNLADLATVIAEADKVNGVGAVLRTARAAQRATVLDMILAAWKAALLSGLKTHVVNVTSNLLTSGLRIPQQFIAGLVGKMHGGAHVYLGETYALTAGMLRGALDGLRVAGHVAWTGNYQVSSHQQNTQTITGANMGLGGRAGQAVDKLGAAVELPFRALSAEDAFFRTMNERGTLYALALRKTLDQGGRYWQRGFWHQVENLYQNPTPDMLERAEDAGLEQTFNRELGRYGKKAQLLLNEAKLLQFILPFFRTPTNILKYAAERTPLAPVTKEWRDQFAKGGAERDEAIAKVITGSSLAALTLAAVGAGLLSGGGEPDKEQKRIKREAGWQPYSVKVGDEWVSYRRIEPLGMIVGMTADAAEVWEYMKREEREQLAAMIGMAFAQNITSKTFLKGISDLANVIADPGRYGENYIEGFAGSTVPAAVGQFTQNRDPIVREVHGALEAIQARLPATSLNPRFNSTTLPARRDTWGEPLRRKEGLGPDIASPFDVSRETSDPVRAEAARLRLDVGMPSKRIYDVKLTPAQVDRYGELSGKTAKEILDRVVQDPAYESLADWQRKALFERVIRSARDAGKALMIPEIGQDEIVKQKMKRFSDGRPD